MVDVAAAVMRREGRVLLARRPAEDRLAGCWEFPGGKIEPGEAPADGMRRELLEEFGAQVGPLRFLGTTTYRYDRGPIRLLFYEVGAPSAELTLHCHSEVAWVRPEALVDYELAPADREFAAHLASCGVVPI